MSNLSLRLPDSLHDKVRELAERDNVSINQFIATAVAEKAAALLTVEYLEARGQRGDGRLLDRVLARVANVPPVPGDEIAGEVRAAGQARERRPAYGTRRRSRSSSRSGKR